MTEPRASILDEIALAAQSGGFTVRLNSDEWALNPHVDSPAGVTMEVRATRLHAAQRAMDGYIWISGRPRMLLAVGRTPSRLHLPTGQPGRRHAGAAGTEPAALMSHRRFVA